MRRLDMTQERTTPQPGFWVKSGFLVPVNKEERVKAQSSHSVARSCDASISSRGECMVEPVRRRDHVLVSRFFSDGVSQGAAGAHQLIRAYIWRIMHPEPFSLIVE